MSTWLTVLGLSPIAVNRADGFGDTAGEIILLFDNVGFAKAFVLRLRRAARPIG
ncbi:MAG: hypothetical protein GY842_10275 [bacterium]|nr:hypothetical protein [bacterium]